MADDVWLGIVFALLAVSGGLFGGGLATGLGYGVDAVLRAHIIQQVHDERGHRA